jgi:outer membrane protein insertion porin family
MMLSKKLPTLCLLALLSASVPALAQDDGSFVANKIQIVGLQRIQPATAMSYLPVHQGQTITPADTGAIISALYQTGFFSDVKLSRSGDTLIINVVERSTIGLIKILGNKQIKTKDLMDALKRVGIVEGEPYDQATLAGVKQALLEQYQQTGRYDATVDTSVTEESRNRVAIDIAIHEGKTAKVTAVNIVGNHAFTTKELTKDFSLGKRPWWAFFSSRDEYSEQKLQQDLDQLQAYYLDRGYLRFKVNSTDAKMTDDKKSVVVTIDITEGDVYRIKNISVSGELLGQDAAVRKLITVKEGEVFSRKKILGIDDAIGRLYGDQGYALAQVNAIPDIDDASHTVSLKFDVNPGRRVYVRHVEYSGNTKTSDEVMRRETRQMEGGVYSVSALDQSKRRLNNLGYLENIETKVEPVPGRPDQVDIKYNVKEASSMTANAQIGFSDTYGFIYGANIVQNNYRGTGKTTSIGFNNSQYAQTYSFNYFNPYYTESGISRGFTVYFQHTTPGDTNIAPYTLDSIGGMMNYRIPLSEYDYFNFGYGYEYIKVKNGDGSTEINNFLNENGDHFNNVKLTAGWTRNTYDRAVLPTKGYNQYIGAEAGAPLLPDSLDYYRLTYDGTYYQPLAKGFILALNGDLGYGNGYGNMSSLPFFKNFYAGGMGTVRGYEANTMGPKDSAGNSLGGNVLTAASVNLIIPNPISENHLRTMVFFDAGNVYENTVDFGDLRYTTGIEVDWVSPMGPLKFSLGKPLNSKDGDKLQVFNFSLGASF